MSTIISVNSLTTLKSQLDLNPADVIAIRDTVDNSVSVGINTVGDFQGYYISTTTPTYNSPFVGITANPEEMSPPFTFNDVALANNVRGTQLGETFTEQLYVKTAKVTVQEYPTTPLIINGATATVTETYTPTLVSTDATLTYNLDYPITIQSASLTTTVGKIQAVKATKVEIIPTIDLKWITGRGRSRPTDLNDFDHPNPTFQNSSVSNLIVPLDPVDVTALLDLENDPIMGANPGQLLVVFNDNRNPSTPEFPIGIVSPKILNGQFVVPLYYTGYGRFDKIGSNGYAFLPPGVKRSLGGLYPRGESLDFQRTLLYGGDDWFSIACAVAGTTNICKSYMVASYTAGIPSGFGESAYVGFGRENSSYVVRITYSDGTISTGPTINFNYTSQIKTNPEGTQVFAAIAGTPYVNAYREPFDYGWAGGENSLGLLVRRGYKSSVSSYLFQLDRVVADSTDRWADARVVSFFTTFPHLPTSRPYAPREWGDYDPYGINYGKFFYLGVEHWLYYAFSSSDAGWYKEPNITQKTLAQLYPDQTSFQNRFINLEENTNYYLLLRLSDAYPCANPYLPPSTNAFFTINKQVTLPLNTVLTSAIDTVTSSLLLSTIEYNPTSNLISATITKEGVGESNSVLVSTSDLSTAFAGSTASTSNVALAGTGYIEETVIVSPTNTSTINVNFRQGTISGTRTTTFRTGVSTGSISVSDELAPFIREVVYSSNTITNTSLGNKPLLDSLNIWLAPNNNYSNRLNLAFFTSTFRISLPILHAGQEPYTLFDFPLHGGRFIGIKLNFSYRYNYDLTGVQSNSVTPPNTNIFSSGVLNFIPNGQGGFILDISAGNPSTYSIPVTETLNIAPFLRGLIRPDYTISYPNTARGERSVYGDLVSKNPILTGYTTIDFSYQGRGSAILTQNMFSEVDPTIKFGFEITDSSIPDIFTPSLRLPQTYDVTAFLNQKIIEDGGTYLYIPSNGITYNVSGGIDAFGISAADLQYCRPEMNTLSYYIEVERGVAPYLLYPGGGTIFTGSATDEVYIDTPRGNFYQTVFSSLDREKNYTSLQLEPEITTLYFTTVSINKAGYTFTEVPIPISDLSSSQTYKYKIHNSVNFPGSFTSDGYNTDVSKLINIDDYTLSRASGKYGFNSISYPPTVLSPLVSPNRKTLFDKYCVYSTVVDSTTGYKNINTLTINPDGQTGPIVNKFFNLKYMYTVDNPELTSTLSVFITPIVESLPPAPLPPPPTPLRPLPPIPPTGPTAGIASYPFWMPDFLQNANGSITGIPILDTSFLQNLVNDYRTFPIQTFNSDYFSTTNNAFSLDGSYGTDYLVGNSFMALQNLVSLASTLEAEYPWQRSDGNGGFIDAVGTSVPQAFKDGFIAKDYRFKSKFFTIQTDTRKQLYVLPFRSLPASTGYNFIYSSSVITLLHCNVNVSNHVALQWPVGISRLPTARGRVLLNGFNIPSPLTVNSANRSYSPIIDARPGYIRVTLPYDGLVLNNTSAAGRLQYYTPYGAITSQNVQNQARTLAVVDQTNPSFFLVYKGFAYNTIFSRGATGYSVIVTADTPQVVNPSSTFKSYLYPDQVYSDLYIQALISPDIGVRVPNVIDVTDITTFYVSGAYVLPKFYIPVGLTLDTTTPIFSAQAGADVLGGSVTITVNLSLNMLKFEGVPIGYEPAAARPRFAISSLGVPNTIGNIQEVSFDLTGPSNNTFTLRGLEPITFYRGFVLSYFPYVSDENPVLRSYSEKVDTNLLIVTNNGGKITGECTSNIVTESPRTYVLVISDVKYIDAYGIQKTEVETLALLGTGNYSFVLDISDPTLASQPYVQNLQRSTNYSTNGILNVPINQDFFTIVQSGLRFQFSVSNLLAGSSYVPEFYLVDNRNTNIRTRPLTFPTAISIPEREFMTRTNRIPTLASYAGFVTYSNFNVFDSLLGTDFSWNRSQIGSIRLMNAADIRDRPDIQPTYYGGIEVTPSLSTRFVVPINKNIIPNVSYNLVPAYNTVKHDPYGWNDYSTTDSYGNRSLSQQPGATAINFLKNTILPYTGLSVNDGISLCSFLGPNAVIFGSSILYACLGEEAPSYFPEAEIEPRDIDIMVNNPTVLNNIVQFIINSASAQTGFTINDPYRLYTGATGGIAGYTLAFGSPNGNAISMLASSAVPAAGGADAMGPISIVSKPSPSIQLPAITNKYGIDADTQILNITLTRPNIPNIKSIQLVLVTNLNRSFTLSEYAQYTSDFTVNAGTFDGTQLVMPYYRDFLNRITVYLDPITNATKSRMIRRMQRMFDRGFTIFLKEQSQIDGWNSIPVSADPVDPWWTDATPLVKQPQFKKPFKPLNSCPFRVLNRLSIVAPDSLSIRFTAPRWNSFGASTDFELFVYTNISSSTQPSFDGTVVISGFNYQKYTPSNSIPTNITDGKITVTNDNGSIVYGSVSVGLGPFPKDITIQMNQKYIPSGSHIMKLRYSWDQPTNYGLDTPVFTYTALDDILPEEKSVPLIRNISVALPSGTTLGGSSVDISRPLIKFVAQAEGVTLAYNAGTSYNPNDLIESADQTFLYRLIGTATGNPIYGNGWENTSTYLKYKGTWSASETYAIGDIVKHNHEQAGDKLYICTGNVNAKLPPAAPDTFDLNTGLLTEWSTDLVTKTLNVSYTAGYTGTLQNCLPNTNYDVYMQFQTGTTFSPLQLVSKVRTLPEKIVVDKVALENNVYTVKNAHYPNSSVFFNNGLILSGGETYFANTTAVVPLGTSRFIRYQPQASLSSNVYDVSNEYTLDYTNFVFTSLDNAITDIQYDSALLTMEPTSTYSFNTNDSIVFLDQMVDQQYENAICVSPIGSSGIIFDAGTPRYISVRITGLTTDTQYNLNAYYVFAGSTQLQSQVNLPAFRTVLDLGYQIISERTITDYIVYMRSFLYDGASIAGVFPYSNPSNSIVINAYFSATNGPPRKYTITGTIVNDTVALFNSKLVDSLGDPVNASGLDTYDLTYTYANSIGEIKIIQKNGLKFY
jgi:hypothetical protein